jgi:hypothetical protein
MKAAVLLFSLFLVIAPPARSQELSVSEKKGAAASGVTATGERPIPGLMLLMLPILGVSHAAA